MKMLKILLAGLALSILPLVPATQNLLYAKDSPPSAEATVEKLLVIGHRGAAGLAPENTLASFRRALETGVDGVEFDVLLAADNEVVVHHDFRLNSDIARSADGQWLGSWDRPVIRNLTSGELKSYDVGRLKPNTAYARRYPEQQPSDGERIPTLRETVKFVKESGDGKIQLWIEIKTSPEKRDESSPPEVVADGVARVLREEGFFSRARLLSFDWRSLVHIQKIAPEIPTVYLSHIGGRLNNIKPGMPGPSPWTAGIDVDDHDGSIPRAVKAAGGRYWAPHYKYITPSHVAEAHGLGIGVFVWTPDSREDMEKVMRMGVDGIITNRPDILISVLQGF